MIEQIRQLLDSLIGKIRRVTGPEAPFNTINDALEAGDYDTVLKETDRIISSSRSVSNILRRRVAKTRMFNSSEEYNNYIRRHPAEAYVGWEYPLAPEAHYHRSLVYQRSGRLKSSRTELENSLRDFPESAKYQTEMGTVLMSMSYFKEAIEHFEQAIKYDFTEDEKYAYRSLTGVGLCCIETGEFDLARKSFHQALEIMPGDREVLSLLHLTMEVENDPRQRAEFFLAKGSNVLAIPAFEEALDQNPQDFEMHLGIAYAYKELQQYDLAEDHIRRAFRYNPGSSQVNFALAWIYLMQDRVDDAETEFLKAVRKNPYDPGYLIGLCYAYLERQKTNDANDQKLIQLIAKAKELDPGYPEPDIVMAEYYLILDQPDKAREAIEAAIKLIPSHQAAHIVAAEVFFELADRAKAQYHLTEAEEYGRDTEEMRLLRDRLKGEQY